MSAAPDFAAPLREEDVDPDPIEQFGEWFRQAGEAGVRAPEAAALATASVDGSPSVRMVLVKSSGTDGFVFYSNYESRKGRDLAANPRAALLFHWDALGRQLRAEGPVERLTSEESATYIRTRPRASQLSALASPQSHVVPSRDELEQRVARLATQYGDDELPLPETWGGFRLRPDSIEFWQHRDDRLHDRLLYTRDDDAGWGLRRLAP
jgi:pyridoxamine 5'-phosphate oxidase